MTANNNTINNNDPTIIGKVQRDPSVRQLIEPVEHELAQQWKINLKFTTIRDIADDKHEVAHDPIKTDMDQQRFLAKCNNFTFPADGEREASTGDTKPIVDDTHETTFDDNDEEFVDDGDEAGNDDPVDTILCVSKRHNFFYSTIS